MAKMHRWRPACRQEKREGCFSYTRRGGGSKEDQEERKKKKRRGREEYMGKSNSSPKDVMST